MYKYIKYKIRSFILAIESRFGGKKNTGILPNGVMLCLSRSHISGVSADVLFRTEIQSYWNAHQPKPGEIHLDVGAQIGSYTLLAASSGAFVYSIEPDANNRRFLYRNLKHNNFNSTIIECGAWNKRAILPFRSHDAISSIQGISEVSTTHPAFDFIKVDTIDHIVQRLGLKKVDVIKMDIEGAEIEAIEGAEQTIKNHRPVLMIESYHIRNGQQTKNKVLSILISYGITMDNIIISEEFLIIAKGY